MSELPAPRPPDFRGRRWLDARLLLGLLLVLLSVVVGAKVFADADQRVQVWSVTRDLGADTPLRGEDLQARSVSLDEATGRYLSAGEDLEGLVLTRPVGPRRAAPGRPPWAGPMPRPSAGSSSRSTGSAWPACSRAGWSTSTRSATPRAARSRRRPSWCSPA